jgi:hypothetical protein
VVATGAASAALAAAALVAVALPAVGNSVQRHSTEGERAQ